MPKRIKKRYDIEVNAANAIHSKTFELDKTVTAIHGMLFASDRDDLMYYRGSAKVEINSDEIFPEGYEVKLLMSGLNVSPNDRYYNLGGVLPGNFKVKIEYKDTPDTRLQFASYRVSIYLDVEIKS
ncbi:hypothetical protein [Flavisolibacter ginsenosidimutans]|uniref:Uncharacterized protein n=1 Tax=Flavisolibacter ginsenosidimutans TaxID=661481 RepID=A0A5B8UIU0_9BACT|nr:hypothetical protein [Flavisolibacter ginsenosidimutans]QEC56584.1 hypothetical protein FSB75_11995 [Flavisolibacter ginsenosidimutans]